ncbi:hypothetical protein RXV95_11595 [Novosphingobium sp. ZN18A2]|uniref:hypothetical protein n=1 Tax=Novosphingobium sp. ZN18A2 TaxID=3079861 RepID=UPI0030D05B53
MALSYEFLQARAEESAREAETAQLGNIKERALRSEAAWREMANRALQIAREREKAQAGRLICQTSE